MEIHLIDIVTIYDMFCIEFSGYFLLLILVQRLLNRTWQVVQEPWSYFIFTFLLEHRIFNGKFKIHVTVCFMLTQDVELVN